MPAILHIETSTTACSVALGVNGSLTGEQTSDSGPSHSALAGVFVKNILGLLPGSKPDAIAVSSGPGSYTGLRIGLSLAKGLCFGYDIPLIAVPTLLLLASQAVAAVSAAEPNAPAALYCPMIDARRMEVYAAVYSRNLGELRPAHAEIVDPQSYSDLLNGGPVYFCGNGSSKCREIIAHPNALFIDNLHPSAKAMIPLAEAAWKEGRFEDAAYFEPFYLKQWGEK
ncbi:MAG: tRNA (adenosine(37)-N6)-threonylcarbamoyltransferase complex dimerization subunit type 1 TsaB [Tannerellaceae bacterium]|jgi:tRNA threonylcarbamoyladenosine biosynthesis protein TsaB|nr:tRNA (adenosine(37)-N6)-threonylcarbamoyltransferase complex dimerization subunit type 1 TsaB [Tannerellaceae bacterium]